MPSSESLTAAEAQRSMQSDISTDSTDAVQPIELLFAWNTEITRFYLNRCQQYWLLPSRLLSCAAPADVQTFQAEFLRKLTEDYRDLATKLLQIAGRPAQSFEKAAQEHYASTLLKAQRDAAAILDQAMAQADRIRASARESVERTDRPDEMPEERAEKRA
jgi:hypothetical protein